jgi:hypothetical protein
VDYAKYPKLEFRRKFWKFVGAEINIVDPSSEQLVGFIKMKAWKLREDVRLYADKSMQHEILLIKARNIIDWSNTYDISDSQTGVQLASLRRKGWKSAFVRDHWEIFDPAGAPMGSVHETSGTLALLRRYLSAINDVFDIIFAFTQQTYDVKLGEALAAHIVHRKNPFIVKMSLDMSVAQAKLDPRITIAATAMLSIIDASKNS